MQGTAELHHEIAHALLPQAKGIRSFTMRQHLTLLGFAVDARCDTSAQVRRAERTAGMAVLRTFREPSLGRHVSRELMRNVWLDFTP